MKARQVERPLDWFGVTSNEVVGAQLNAECADIAQIKVVMLEKDEIRKMLKISYVTDIDIALNDLHYLPVIEGEIEVNIDADISTATNKVDEINNFLINKPTDGEALYRVRFEFRAPLYDLKSLKEEKFANFQTEFLLPDDNGTAYRLEIVGVEKMHRVMGGTTFTGIATLTVVPGSTAVLPSLLVTSSLNPLEGMTALRLGNDGAVMSRLRECPRWITEMS